MRAKRKYAQDFKREAVRLVTEEGLGIREVERNLGITYGVLKGWVQKHQDHNDAAFVGRIDPQSPEAELKQLFIEDTGSLLKCPYSGSEKVIMRKSLKLRKS